MRTADLSAPIEHAPTAEARSPHLSVWDAVAIIVGIVIGAGIYETAPLVFANSTSGAQALTLWALGGALSLVGAACYAELASTYPRSGGDYVYLSRAYAPIVGFLFGWAQLAVILTGSIGMMAYVFADYSAELWPMPDAGKAIVAGAAVLVLTLVNVFGMVVGKTAQNLLSIVKVVGLLAIAIVAFSAPIRGSAAPPSPEGTASVGLAMILVLYTFGGWNDAAFVAAEVRGPKRNIARALVLGTAAVTLIYLLVNAAFIAALGFDGARQSKAIAADVLRGPFGEAGARGISVLVMISALSAVNGLILTGSRVYATLGTDYSVFARLGQWHPRWRSPISALAAQLVVSVGMIAAVGTGSGRRSIDALLTALGGSPASWAGHGGFDTLLRCTAPVFWLFFLLTGVSLFVLRSKDSQRERPFRVPLYPILPLLFCGTCLYMLYSAVDYAGALTWFGVLPLAAGVPLYFTSKQKPKPAVESPAI
jgi:amino acid transporter